LTNRGVRPNMRYNGSHPLMPPERSTETRPDESITIRPPRPTPPEAPQSDA